MLNSVPSFYFSYTNMPIKVLSKVVKIQREFFRGVGRLLENKLSEEEIHLSSKEHRLRVSNLSLLAKWRLRLINEGRSLWKDVLVARYGEEILSRVYWGGFSPPANPSKWWQDIINLDDWSWFNKEVMRIGMFISHDICFLKWFWGKICHIE